MYCAGHCPLFREVDDSTSTGLCLVWNYKQVLRVLHQFQCVIGCVAGHDHQGAVCQDSDHLPHIIINGIVETPPTINAHATAYLCNRSLEIKGTGMMVSASLKLKFPLDDSQSSSSSSATHSEDSIVV